MAEIRNVWRTWKDEPAVRSTVIDNGGLIVSHLGPGKPLKACIKDAVRNKYALIPCLKIIAATADFNLFNVKDAGREPLALLIGNN